MKSRTPREHSYERYQAIPLLNCLNLLYFLYQTPFSKVVTMPIKIYKILCCCFAISFASAAVAQEPSLQELQQRCEQAREAKIAPLRQEAIDECITSNPRRRDVEDWCAQFYSDFGQGGRTASGHFRQPMFNDLPECVEYREAEAQSRDSGRSR